MSTYDQVFVRNLTLHMSIGILDHEQTQKQRVIVDADIFIVPCTDRHDDIDNTVRYDSVIQSIRNLSEHKHYNLVETFAEDIASTILSLPGVHHTDVSITKPDIMGNNILVGVKIRRP